MRSAYSLVSLAIIFDLIESSFQFDRSRNDTSIPFVSQSGTSSFSPDGRDDLPEPSLSPAQPLLRPRSRSPPASASPSYKSIVPPTRLPSPDGNGCGLEQLEFIRLIPYLNSQNLTFELRRYTFPGDKSIRIILPGISKFGPVPTEEQIVLSTSNDDVFAILETYNVLAGIYKYVGRMSKRVKMNMESHTITELTQEEVNDIPVGSNRFITRNFRIENVNYLPEQPLPHAEPFFHSRSESSSARAHSPPGSIISPKKLPSPDGRGCGLENLSYLRLIPYFKTNTTCKLKRYSFPDDKSIKINIGQNIFRPVPTKEQIVLVTPDNDVVAILETHDVLAAIYKYINRHIKRVKINMDSNTIIEINREEMKVYPVGAHRTIMSSFCVMHVRNRV